MVCSGVSVAVHVLQFRRKLRVSFWYDLLRHPAAAANLG
jgi:hypothetical protein